MKRSLKIIIVLIVLAIMGVVAYGVFRPHKESNILTLYGNVDVRQVDIGFRVAGQVAELFVQEGDEVVEGDLIATLITSPYLAEVEQAAANVESIMIDLENAEAIYQRRLAVAGDQAVSQEDLDNAKTNRDQLVANLLFAQGSLTIAKDRLSYTLAYAPSDATVLTRIREIGSVINPADPVYTLSIKKPVWIRAFVDEPNLGDVYYGMPVLVYTDRTNGKIYKGKVGFISPVAEFTPKTVQTTALRTDLVYRLRIYIDDPDQHLVQGMPVTVQLMKKYDNQH